MNYGMPYKGSKNQIAGKIINSLPSATHFYDLFGGGGAISHCALLSGKYKYVHYNELDPLVFKGFKMAVNGEFKDEKRWISREDFNKLKDSDPYVAICFSFGNDLRGYLYGEEKYEFKKAVHYSICFDNNTLLEQYIPLDNFNYSTVDLNERRLELQRYMKRFLDKGNEEIFNKIKGKCVIKFDRNPRINSISENLARLGRLKFLSAISENLERLERIKTLNNLDKHIILSNKSYEEIEIEKNSIIYCDPPYANTSQYRIEFDHNNFYEWSRKQDNIFISEYNMPDDFKVFKSFDFNTRLAQTVKTKTVENLYVNNNYTNCLEEW